MASLLVPLASPAGRSERVPEAEVQPGLRVFNDLGEVVCVARVDERVSPGVVCIPKGAWMKSSLNGRVSTALSQRT